LIVGSIWNALDYLPHQKENGSVKIVKRSWKENVAAEDQIKKRDSKEEKLPDKIHTYLSYCPLFLGVWFV